MYVFFFVVSFKSYIVIIFAIICIPDEIVEDSNVDMHKVQSGLQVFPLHICALVGPDETKVGNSQ